MGLNFLCTRLWRYHSLYFLKPFDAVNDTLTASLLSKFKWDGQVTEIGSGDGVFSYIMHGGKFRIGFDRYLSVDLKKGDIFDTHKAEFLSANKIESPSIALSIDAKANHAVKVKEIGFSKDSIVSSYEDLPMVDDKCDQIFYYTAHGMRNHQVALKEAARVLRPDGRMYVLLYTEHVMKYFICHKLGELLPGAFGRYFSNLDNGRAEEIAVYSRKTEEWERLFSSIGLQTITKHEGLSGFAWAVYDIQTRPIFKCLITVFNCLPYFIRTVAKVIVMIITYPVLVLFYLIFSNRYLKLFNNCYVAFELRKTT